VYKGSIPPAQRRLEACRAIKRQPDPADGILMASHRGTQAMQNTARRRLRDHLSGVGAVYAFSAMLCAVAAGVWALFLRDLEPIEDVGLRWWMLVPAFLIVEVLVVHLDVNREAQTISLSEIPIIVGLFFATPAGLVAAQVIGGGLALVLHRRQSMMKTLFNLAQFGTVTAVVIGVFRLALGDAPTSPWSWLAAFVAVVVGDLLAAGLVSTAIGLLQGWSWPNLREFLVLGLAGTVANTGLGLLGVELIRYEHVDALLLTIPFAVTYLAYRGFWRERRRSQHFEFLYESMRRLSTSRDLEQAVGQLLHEARSMFSAELAGVVLLSNDLDEPIRRSVLGPEEALVMLAPTSLRPDLAALDEPILIPTEPGKPAHYLELLGRTVEDAIAITLRGEDGAIGALVVANRAGDVSTFTRADLTFLQTFATHAAVALENRLLQDSLGELAQAHDELAHRVLHDPLTRLANRTLFSDRLEHALSKRDDATYVGVLFVDLDDFKGVNDLFGHEAGDLVLTAVAERLRACLRPGDTAARLGGDEFTVLLENVSGLDEVAAVSARILEALRMPVAVGDAEIPVNASIGHTLGQPGALLAADLIRQADSAMYVAKSNGKGRAAAAPGHSPATQTS
jgi:diguanylate cyclase (GGDEF)-like protein